MYKIFLSGIDELGNGWRLPINPHEEFTISVENKFERVDVFKLGEVILKRHKSLQSFGWKSFLPANPDVVRVFSGIENYQCDPVGQAAALKNAENTIINLVITLPNQKDYIDMDVILSKFRTIDKGGIPGDIYYEIDLVEFKEPQIVETPSFYNVPISNETVSGFSGTLYVENKNTNTNQTVSKQIGIGDTVEYSGRAYKLNSDQFTKLALSSNTRIFDVDNSIYTEESKSVEISGIAGDYKYTKEVQQTKKNYVLQNITGYVKEIELNGNDAHDYKGPFYKIRLTEQLTKADPLSQLKKGVGDFLKILYKKEEDQQAIDKATTNKVSEIWIKGDTTEKKIWMYQ